HWDVKVGGSGTQTFFSSSRSIFVTDFGSSTNQYVAVYVVTQGTPQVTTPVTSLVGPEGTSTAFNLGSFADPDGGPWTVSVNWGHASLRTTFTTNTQGNLGTANHTFTTSGVFTVSVKVTDKDGGFNTATFQISVGNQAPTATVGLSPASPHTNDTLT